MKKLGQFLVLTIVLSFFFAGTGQLKAQNPRIIQLAKDKIVESTYEAEENINAIQAEIVSLMQNGSMTCGTRGRINSNLSQLLSETDQMSRWAERLGDPAVSAEVSAFAALGAQFRDLVNNMSSSAPAAAPNSGGYNDILTTGSALSLTAGGIRREVQLSSNN